MPSYTAPQVSGWSIFGGWSAKLIAQGSLGQVSRLSPSGKLEEGFGQREIVKEESAWTKPEDQSISISEPKADLWSDDVNRRIACAIDHGRKIGLMRDGDRIVVVAGWKPKAGTSNAVRVVELGSLTEHNILGIPDIQNYKD